MLITSSQIALGPMRPSQGQPNSHMRLCRRDNRLCDPPTLLGILEVRRQSIGPPGSKFSHYTLVIALTKLISEVSVLIKRFLASTCDQL